MQTAERASLNRLLKEANFFTSASEVRRFEWEGALCIVALYTLLTLATLNILPVYVLLVTPVLYARYLLGGHEILHTARGPRINWLSRLMPFSQSLFTAGYPEYRDIHLRHHRYLGSPADPEDYLVSASSHWRAFLKAMLEPERTFFVWIEQKGVTPGFVLGSVIRAALFVGFLWANPRVFLTYLVIMRLAIGGSQFFFHNILHMFDLEARDRIVYGLLPKAWWSTLRTLFGSEKVDILLVHDVHHRNQLIAAHKLERAREFIADYERSVQNVAA